MKLTKDNKLKEKMQPELNIKSNNRKSKILKSLNLKKRLNLCKPCKNNNNNFQLKKNIKRELSKKNYQRNNY